MVGSTSLPEGNLQPLTRSLQQVRSAIASLLDKDASTLATRQTASVLLDEHLVVLSSLQSELAGRIAPSNRIMLPSEALLDALQFLDYNTVVKLMFASSILRDLAQKCIERYQTTAKNMVVIIEENALRVFCPAKKKSRARVALCHRAENYSTCDDWSCSTVHIAEAGVKFRALLGFSRVDHVEIHADWNDTMMKRLLTFVPMLKSARMITLGQRAGGLAPVIPVPLQRQQMMWPPTPLSRAGSATLPRFVEYFDDVATLWVHGVDEATFDWTVLRDPRILNLMSLRLMNLREEPNVEEVVRYCSEPASDTLSCRHLALLGAPLGKEFVKEISRVVDQAKHELSVHFECDVEITSDDIWFDSEPPFELGQDAVCDTIRGFKSLNSDAVLLRIAYRDGQVCYVISSQMKEIEVERLT